MSEEIKPQDEAAEKTTEPVKEKEEKEEKQPPAEAKDEVKPQEEKQEKDPNKIENENEMLEALKELKISNSAKSKVLKIWNINEERADYEKNTYSKESVALENKFDLIYERIYKKINDIVKNKNIPEISEEDKKKYNIKDSAENEKSEEIKDYWEKVIINSRYFTITNKDKPILKYLSLVDTKKIEGMENDFTVNFYFDENEYFTNKILSKTFIFDKDDILKEAQATKIDWKSEDKNVTVEKKKVKAKGKGGRRKNKYKDEYKEEIQDVDCFFALFKNVSALEFLEDEVTFFKDDLFANQFEYYLDFPSKTKITNEEDENEDDDDEDNKKGDKKPKEECKNQ